MIQEQAFPHRYDSPTPDVDSIKSQRYNICVLLRLTIYCISIWSNDNYLLRDGSGNSWLPLFHRSQKSVDTLIASFSSFQPNRRSGFPISSNKSIGGKKESFSKWINKVKWGSATYIELRYAILPHNKIRRRGHHRLSRLQICRLSSRCCPDTSIHRAVV